MYDLSVPNNEPGTCEKCHGSGLYQWGPCVNGVMKFSGSCHSCRGTGQQDKRQIARNRAYNRHKVSQILGG